MKHTFYLVGNAHLDPVWQWRWQEGSMEAKATIRSALDRMKEFPEFRFVCSSASVYQWVEEFAPEMFEEVRTRVAEGRFIIVGGWHVQPDCNLPSGEAYARQSLYAQRYFQETFGTTAKIGYNVDSFGHNAMLPQILKKSGMDSYIFMRPCEQEKHMDSDIFRWVSDDGSAVTAFRIPDPYCFNFRTLEELENRIAWLEENTQNSLDAIPLFYGVGNHGGGPTIRNLEILREFSEKHPEKKLIYSDLQDFFDSVRLDIPQYRGDLQHHASGCYSAVPEIKSGIRRAENDLMAAERFGFLAGKTGRSAAFRDAWNQVCFCHFHDCMDGCSVKEVYDDAAHMLGMSRHIAATEENNALQTLSWRVDTHETEKGLPVVVFNPHSFEVAQTIRVCRSFGAVADHLGGPIPSQQVRSSAESCSGRTDTLFTARVPALGHSVYYLREAEPPAQATPHSNAPVLENEYLKVTFEPFSGYITSIYDKRSSREWLQDKGAVPVVIDEYPHDTWSHAKNFFTDEMARFSDATVTVTETGPVRSTVKVVSHYNSSTLTQYFSLCAGCAKLEVRATVDWHEKHKMLKLAWPMAVEDPEAFYEIPFGVIRRPADGEEEPGIHWTAVKGTSGGFAIVNDCTYSSSVKGSTLYHTILRSPIYCDHGGARTSESEFTAQGRFDFTYILMETGDDWICVSREGQILNKGLTNIVETWHRGDLPDSPTAGISIDAPNVLLSAIKRSEDGTGTILRLREITGRDADYSVTGQILPCPLAAHITPWSVQTWFCRDGGSHWQEVLLTEYPME